MRAGVFLLLIALGAFAQKPSQTSGAIPQRAEAAAQRAEAAARAATAANAEAQKKQEEALKKLDTASTEIMGRASYLQTVSSLTTGFVAFAAGLFGIAGTIVAVVGGHRMSESLKKIKQGEIAANDSVAAIVKMEERLKEHKLFVDNLQVQVQAALKDIEDKLDVALTPGTGLIGVALTSAVPQRSYDDDALIVFADRLRMDDLPPGQRADFLVKVSNYWRRWKEYDRAIERARRAAELDSSSPSAHKALGRAIWNRVTEDLAATAHAISSAQLKLLEEAESELKTAQGLLTQGNRHDEEIPFDLAAICRFKGDIPGAVDHYQRGAQLSKALARSEQRAPDWDFDFALACLYAKTGQYPQALDQMKEVVGKTESWSHERRRAETRDYRDWMRSDPDFAAMLADAKWEPQLKAL